MQDKFVIWNPGGVQEWLPIDECKKRIGEMRYERNCIWERREAGISVEETWGYQEHEFDTLQHAVDVACPWWEEFGLSFWQAAMICFEATLVISTGIEIEEETDE